MAKLFALLTLIMVTASLRAVTVLWSVPEATGNLAWMDDSTVTYQFVYSETGNYNNASAWNATVAESVAATGSNTNFKYATSQERVYGDKGESYVSATFPTKFDSNGASIIDSSAYYYLVVFKTGTNDYAVLGGLNRYTTTEGSSTTTVYNGIYDTAVDGNLPETGAYFDLSQLTNGGLIVATPEPTALALLALGVAGLALRRKYF